MPMSFKRLFAEFLDEPVVVVTGDQDWAPEWAISAALGLIAAAAVPYHVFVTNESRVLDRVTRGERVTFGIHPNFLSGSTQGATPDTVIETCRELVPSATTFRTHCLCEDNWILRSLASHGFVADSNVVGFLQPDLVPLLHAAGLLRLPIFFEDAWFLEWGVPDLGLEMVKQQLARPGLKVLNVHPALLAINAPSMDYYNERRPHLYGEDAEQFALDPYPGRGAASLLFEIVEFAVASGIRITSFPAIVDDAMASVREEYGEDLYGWPRHPLLHNRPAPVMRARMTSR
jgi:hypothetical protein